MRTISIGAAIAFQQHMLLLSYLTHLQRWCQNGGYIEGEAPIDLDISKPSEEVVGAFARFLKWYADGRKGDANAARRGGRKVSMPV